MLKLPKFLDEQQREAILSEPWNDPIPDYEDTRHRNYVMMRLIINAGFRSAELLALNWSQVTWKGKDRGAVWIRNGKGGRDRRVYLGDVDLALLKEHCKQWGIKRGALFLSIDGTRLGYKSLYKLVTRYSKRADLPFLCTPHTLRHTFATDCYRSEQDLLLVARCLGHASVQTTEIYTHMVDERKSEAMRRLGDSR